MARLIILCALISNLALFTPCMAFQAISGGSAGGAGGTVQKGKSAKPGPTSSQPASVQNENADRGVVNIVVDRIEDGAIYSKDGTKYEINGSIKVTDNSHRHRAAKAKTAELFFENGSLVSVVVK